MLKPVVLRLHALWQPLPQRDRTALAGLALFAAGLLLVFGVWLPITHFHQQARAEFDSQHSLYQWLQSQEAILRPLQASRAANKPATSNSPPLTIVNTSARELSLTIKRLQPEANGDLRLWLENVTFDAGLHWLHQLESQGLTIKDLQADRQQTGVVNLQLTLQTNKSAATY